MPKGAVMTLKIAVLLVVSLLAFIGIAYVCDLVTSDLAQELAVKMLVIVGILAAASLVIAMLGGNKGDNKDSSKE